MSSLFFKKLKKDILSSGKKCVLVTGPQRSGTTVAAKMLANILGWGHIDEEEFRWESRGLFEEVIKKDNLVIQAPCLSCIAHEYSASLYIVFMVRPLLDIYASEERIGWKFSDYELKWNVKKFHDIPEEIKTPAEAKYYVWQNMQKPFIQNFVELKYSDLEGHPLFLSKDQRIGFGPKQTS